MLWNIIEVLLLILELISVEVLIIILFMEVLENGFSKDMFTKIYIKEF